MWAVRAWAAASNERAEVAAYLADLADLAGHRRRDDRHTAVSPAGHPA